MKMSQEEKLKRSYIVVRCPSEECEAETIVFAHAKNTVVCKECGEVIAKPLGGKADIIGEVLRFAGQPVETEE